MFMQNEQYITITQEVKYSSLGNISADTKKVWIVLHGYGQLSRFFIRKFSVLESPISFVIAPQATSKFYLKNNGGRVGANWMTKEDRLVDIRNYTTYLNQLYDSLKLPETVEVNVIGFSQGAATASRWLADGYVKASNLLLWSGIFPPDLDIINTQNALSKTNVYNIYGLVDPYFTTNKAKEQEAIITELKLDVKHIKFDGGHDIDSKTLEQFV